MRTEYYGMNANVLFFDENALMSITEAAGHTETTAIKSKLYPKVAKLLEQNLSKYKRVVSTFIDRRSKDLYDIAPYSNMYFTQKDADEFYKAIGITEKEIEDVISQTYFYPITNFNPRSAKDPFTCLQTCVIRYFFLSKKEKELVLSISVLMLSGKFYPSAFFMSFPKVSPSEYREVMLYTVNNKLTNKYDIKAYGSLFGALRSIGDTWINTYDDMIKSFTDEDYVYIIQQLQTRLRSFMKNIAEEYYDCYENKEYLTFDSDNFEQDNYRVADNDSLKTERIIEKTIDTINTSDVSDSLCKIASNDRIKTNEIKSIIQYIFSDPANRAEVRELITLIVNSYNSQSNTKDVRDISFITFTIAAKPNTKDKNILRQKQIIQGWLEKSPSSFNKRRTSPNTESAYYKAVYTYFALLIHNSNK